MTIPVGSIEKMVLLQMIDQAWKNHLYDLDHMKKYIHLRAYGQKDPKLEYQREAFGLFNTMLDRIRRQTVEYLFRIQAPRRPVVRTPAVAEHEEPQAADQQAAQGEGAQAPAGARRSLLQKGGAAAPAAVKKIGRNQPCPCGSGKKYKKCCGA